jgi:hypothetical protein
MSLLVIKIHQSICVVGQKVGLILITKRTLISENDSKRSVEKEKLETRCRLMVNYQLNNS